MATGVQDVLQALDVALSSLDAGQRRRVLEDSIVIYERDGRKDVADALRERLAREPAAVTALAAARVTRDAPHAVAEFVSHVSLEKSPGCEHPDCRAYVLGVEAGMLTARLDAEPQEWNGTYHADNAHILERVAKAKGYSATFERSPDGTWVFGTFTPEPPTPRLSIVRNPLDE